MKKKCLLAAILAAFTLSIPMTVGAAEMPDQSGALAAYSAINESFGDPMAPVYPDEYAGGYLDGEKLVILLTDLDAADHYLALCGGFDKVTFVEAGCSYAELEKAMEGLNKLLGMPGIAGFGIDVKGNCIALDYVKDEADLSMIKTKIELLKAAGEIPDVPFVYNEVEGYAVAGCEPASADTSGESWTDPETGYVYEDGVNATVQGDIMLLSELDEDMPAAADPSGESWTDPETGYVYEDGVNATVQGDIMLLSDEGVIDEVQGDIMLIGDDLEEAEPIDSVPPTGVAGSSLLPAGIAAAAALLLKKRK